MLLLKWSELMLKKFFTVLVIFCWPIFLQSCSVTSQTEEKSTTTKKPEIPDLNSEAISSVDPHAMHHPADNMKDNNIDTKVQLIEPPNINANQPVKLAIAIKDNQDKPISKFETFQEKLMHFILVSDNLQSFNHLHPQYKQNGKFEVLVNFPKSGKYTIFVDYKPLGKKEQVSVVKTQVNGNNNFATDIDLNQSKIFANTKVNLSLSQPTISAKEEVKLTFNLQDIANNQIITDLKPYLGEKGHLVIVKQSSPLTVADYIHAHAIKNTPAGQVQFMTSFPQPGKYKLWGQFNRNGQIITADFWVNVI